MNKYLSVAVLGLLFLFAPVFMMAQNETTMTNSVNAIVSEDMEQTNTIIPTDDDVGEIAIVTAQAKAIIQGTTEGSPISGQIMFNETSNGLIVDAEVFNVPNSGLHGFHVHEKGSCAENGSAAGGHYNPDGMQHGQLMKDGLAKAHAGDMGNIEIDDKGHGAYTGFLPGITLTGEKYNISGLAVILHEKADDFGQPTGNAGGRIGCGVITKE